MPVPRAPAQNVQATGGRMDRDELTPMSARRDACARCADTSRKRIPASGVSRVRIARSSQWICSFFSKEEESSERTGETGSSSLLSAADRIFAPGWVIEWISLSFRIDTWV